MIEVYIDGASAGDPGPSGAGIIIKGNGKTEAFSYPLGTMSNHEAEFHALILALKLCLERKHPIVSFRTDSQIVEKAAENRYAKNKLFAPLLEEAVQLMDQFDLFFIKWIPSKLNPADRAAKEGIRQNKK
ncbi:reverse transcriptase-like protein [Bacillus sp. FJAT-42376]|uniref:reverse transcriptase-like protein n=1 Tax=Bacillus sp. FJAT-42376 TaxID=2014076 RepID=UPI000F516359|nr:reverse transcriptase-like protein [Bacillus sp. FJAT-42376]AZB43274.1 reverse transcriptase-like protein [Bacillus sp. FJAT-42376]